MEDSVRWSLTVSRQTDRKLRAYLGQAGSRNHGLSRFIELAVRDRLSTRVPPRKARAEARERFAKALEEVRERTLALPQAQIEKLATEAVAYARKRR